MIEDVPKPENGALPRAPTPKASPPAQLRVREYLRVSKDSQQASKSPDQQHDENVKSFDRQCWLLHPDPPYRDTDRSASRYATRDREDFKRLIVDLESDTFDADVLAIWESSRGSRRVGEWVDLVDLCKERGVRIWVTTHSRLYDPAIARCSSHTGCEQRGMRA